MTLCVNDLVTVGGVKTTIGVVAVLLAALLLGSPPPLIDTVLLALSGASAATDTVSVMGGKALLDAAESPRKQLTVCPAIEQFQPVPVADKGIKPAARVSVTVTAPTLAPLPELVAVKVKLAPVLCPLKNGLVDVLLIVQSGAATFKIATAGEAFLPKLLVVTPFAGMVLVYAPAAAATTSTLTTQVEFDCTEPPVAFKEDAPADGANTNAPHPTELVFGLGATNTPAGNTSLMTKPFIAPKVEGLVTVIESLLICVVLTDAGLNALLNGKP
jgi:hypothetical protein